MSQTVRCEIQFQKGKHLYAEFPLNTSGFSKDGFHVQVTEESQDGCRLGKISLQIKNQSCRENANLAMEKPVKLWLPFQRPEKITAMYLFNEWWTRPAFPKSFQEIPDRTQTVFFQYKDRYACMVLMAGQAFKTLMTSGTDQEVCLEMSACLGGQRAMEEPLYLLAEAPGLYEAIEKAFTWIAHYKGIRLRQERRIPEMFRYLGWCSWDAFYTKVNETGIRQKAEELAEKDIPVRWMLIDDGWMTSQEELLCDFAPDREKFPNGFLQMTEDIRAKTDVRWFGVWHALGGYWGGIAPGSVLEAKEAPYLYKTVNGKLLPSPLTGEGFYRDWYEALNREGIRFVKVDGQSAIPYYFENSLPLCDAARGMNQGLESGASRMDGAVINCMGMAMESILARPASAISRNSDDFCPDKEGGFAEHLLQNAYNSLYHNELYCCDWDMFWTMHPDAIKHSLLRAISGGPVYVSDKPGATDPEVLKPLIYQDGELLRMERSAKPTVDCAFSDPLAEGVLKLHNVAPYGDRKGGGIAAFNLTGQRQGFSFQPSDIPELTVADTYWVYDYFGRKAFTLARNERYEGTLDAEGYGWFVVLPMEGTGTTLGLLDKFVGFTAVESICEQDGSLTAVLHESGSIGWLSEKEPKHVWANGVEVTAQVEHQGNLYVVDLPETSHKLVLTLLWE